MMYQIRTPGTIVPQMSALMLFGGDEFRELRSEVKRELVPIEMPEGVQMLDRQQFTPVQEAHYQASLYMDQNDWPRAAEAVRQTISLEPPPHILPALYTLLGMASFQANDLNDSVRAFREAIRLQSDSGLAHLFLGVALLALKKFEGAAASLKKSQEINPSGPHVNFYLGYVYSKLGQLDDAISAYNAEIDTRNGPFEAYKWLADIHYRSAHEDRANREHHLKEVIKTYQRLTAVDPKNAQAYNFIGCIYAELGDSKEAIEFFQRSLDARPDYVTALRNLGTAYLSIGSYWDAKELFERAIGLFEEGSSTWVLPSSADLEDDARNDVGLVYQLLGAARLQVYASRFSSEQAPYDRSLLGQVETALMAALRYSPDDINTLYNLGNVYYFRNWMAAAAKIFARVLELDPNNEDAAKRLHSVRQELERMSQWLTAKIDQRLREWGKENPLYTENLLDIIAEEKTGFYQGIDIVHEHDVFSPEALLQGLLPVAEWMDPTSRSSLASGAWIRNWLSFDQAAKLAGVDPAQFRIDQHTEGMADPGSNQAGGGSSNVTKISAADAESTATSLLLDNLPDRYMADGARLDPEKNQWNVSVVLVYPGLGIVGKVGEIIVSGAENTVVSHTPFAVMRSQARSLYEQHRDAIEAPVL